MMLPLVGADTGKPVQGKYEWLAPEPSGGASSINKANGLISTARLNMLPCVHLPPIYLVVFQEAHREYLSWSGLRA